MQFCETFYAPEGADPYNPNTWQTDTDRPYTLIAAIFKMERSEFCEACQLAGIDPDSEASHWQLMTHAQQYDESATFCVPAEYYLDPDETISVFVYDDTI